MLGFSILRLSSRGPITRPADRQIYYNTFCMIPNRNLVRSITTRSKGFGSVITQIQSQSVTFHVSSACLDQTRCHKFPPLEQSSEALFPRHDTEKRLWNSKAPLVSTLLRALSSSSSTTTATITRRLFSTSTTSTHHFASDTHCIMPASLPQLSDVIAFVAPPPVSPWFQTGGKFQGWNEDLSLVAFFIAALTVLDKIIITPLIRDKVKPLSSLFLKPLALIIYCFLSLIVLKAKSDKTRYFALHAVANAVSLCAAFPDVVRAFTQVVFQIQL